MNSNPISNSNSTSTSTFDFSKYISVDNLHHAYVIEAEPTAARSALLSFLESVGINVTRNPDIFIEDYGTFGINESRELKARQQQAALTVNGKKFFLYTIGSFTNQAESALLKTFEEPTPDTHFFIFISRADNLLATLKSRVQIIKMGKTSSDRLIADNFLNLNIGERILFINKLIKKHEKDENSNLLKEEANELLNGLEVVLMENDKLKSDSILSFRILNKSREFVAIQGSSVKMILEEIAVLL